MSASTPLWTKNARTWRAPSRRRSMSPVLPGREVAHRQREQTAGEEVERRDVESDRDLGEQVALDEGRAGDRQQHGDDHGHQHPEQLEVAGREDAVDDDLSQDRQDELERRGDDRERDRDQAQPPVRAQERPHPGKARPRLRRVLQALRVADDATCSRSSAPGTPRVGSCGGRGRGRRRARACRRRGRRRPSGSPPSARRPAAAGRRACSSTPGPSAPRDRAPRRRA